jgi:hypothetical protein
VLGLLLASPESVVRADGVSGRSTPTTGYGLWSDHHRPPGRVLVARKPTTVGTPFTTARRGRVYGVQFYQTRSRAGTHVVKLWTGGGRLLASARVPRKPGARWRTAYFKRPVTVSSATRYVAGHTLSHGSFVAGPARPRTTRVAKRRSLVGFAGVAKPGRGFPLRGRTIAARNYFVDVVFAPLAHKELTKGFPGASNTGVPPGTRLTNYRGPMTISRNGTVINAKRIDGDLRIRARNVVVKNSFISGDVRIDPSDRGYSMTVKDSEVDAGRARGQDAYDGTGIGARDFRAIRVDVHGGKRGVNCNHNCTVRDSWIHDQARDDTGLEHESAVRMGDHARIMHNTLLCNGPNVAPEAGCSADLTGYGDFAPVRHNLIEHNLFKATPSGGTCAYGGSSGGKPYSDDAGHIRFIDNVFERGAYRSQYGTYICGYYATVMDFDRSAIGNVFSGNVFDTGQRVS